MEYHKGMMKTYLFENLRFLMQHHLFEKITIKQICDQTGVIRATFYNYFDDKYDCLNAIVYHDFVENSHAYLEADQFPEIIGQILQVVEDNRDFYRVAYSVSGQNSFEDMVRANLAILFKEYFVRYRRPGYLEQYSNDLLSRYYAECVAFDLRTFVFRTDGTFSVKDTRQMVLDLATNSLSNFTRKN
jgi:AcrR family transcriptional regulator